MSPLVPPSAPGAAQREVKPRIFWMAAVASLAFFVLLLRLYQLQILRGDEYKERADENFVKELRVPADRGLIVDRNHRVLVDSRPSYDVSLTPYFCGKACNDVLARLAVTLAFTPEELERAQKQLESARGLVRFKPFRVKVDITRDELDVFEANKMDLPGVDVIPTPHRSYRHGASGSHLFGYMNEIGPEELEKANAQIAQQQSAQGGEGGQLRYQLGDFIGRRGLERRYEPVLRGIDGKRRVVVDAKGRAKGDSDLIPEDQRFVESQPGTNLVLSIDWRLQEFAEKTFPATAGSVVAMDAKTGFLLALVNRPAPDPNKLSGRISRAELAAIHSDPLQPELFRAIQQHYHPGSTFKVVTAIAALEEGFIKPHSSVFCPGHYTLGRHRWRCDKDSGHGYVDLNHALGASCDVFFYEQGPKLGANGIAKWGSMLGLGKPTGLDIAGEIGGVLPDEAWHDARIPGGYQKGMAVNLTIGQGDLNVTPMQQVVLYGALASGTVWKPQVVLRMEDARGEVLKEFAPEARGRLPIKESTREAVLQGLRAAVNEPYGTAFWQRLKDVTYHDKPVLMAGKTGTAQVVKLGAKRLKASQVEYFQRDHAWFVGFAPLEDPEIVVVALNEHSGFGSTNAAPTVSAMVKYWLELKKQDAMERAGVPRPPADDAAREGTPPPVRKVPPPPAAPGEKEKPALGQTGAVRVEGSDADA